MPTSGGGAGAAPRDLADGCHRKVSAAYALIDPFDSRRVAKNVEQMPTSGEFAVAGTADDQVVLDRDWCVGNHERRDYAETVAWRRRAPDGDKRAGERSAGKPARDAPRPILARARDALRRDVGADRASLEITMGNDGPDIHVESIGDAPVLLGRRPPADGAAICTSAAAQDKDIDVRRSVEAAVLLDLVDPQTLRDVRTPALVPRPSAKNVGEYCRHVYASFGRLNHLRREDSGAVQASVSPRDVGPNDGTERWIQEQDVFRSSTDLCPIAALNLRQEFLNSALVESTRPSQPRSRE
jgi:hypothetical protein